MIRRLWAAGGRPRGYSGEIEAYQPSGDIYQRGRYNATGVGLDSGGSVVSVCLVAFVGGAVVESNGHWIPGLSGTPEFEPAWFSGMLWAHTAEVWADGGDLYRSCVSRGFDDERRRLLARGLLPARVLSVGKPTK